MKQPYYIYITEDYIEQTKEYLERIRKASADGCAVFFIGPDYDKEKLKSEIEYAVKRQYHIYTVFDENTVIDSDNKKLLGASNRYDFSDDSFKQLEADLCSSAIIASTTNGQPEAARLAVMLSVMAFTAVLAIFIIKMIMK